MNPMLNDLTDIDFDFVPGQSTCSQMVYKMCWLTFCVNWFPLESHPENSGHPVRYYCRCKCLGSSHMVIVCLVLQPPICGISCRQILEIRRLLEILSLF